MCEAQQQQFALLFEDDGSSTEENESLELGSVFEEFSGVLELEGVVMVIGLRSKADFLDDNFLCLGGDFLLLLLLVVQELLVVNDFTNRRIGFFSDEYQIQLLLLGAGQGRTRVNDNGFFAVLNQANTRCADFVIDSVGVLFFTSAWAITASAPSS